MSGQNAMRSEIRAKPSAAMDGAPLKLEQFLPYQLNVVAAQSLGVVLEKHTTWAAPRA